MENYKTNFLDYGLDHELYVSRPYVKDNQPLRVLITDAGLKFVYCLIYKICTGQVFGEDREIYINLVNSRGVIDHKSIFLELEECGFHLLKGWLVTSNVEEAYKDVDIVVLSIGFDQQSGITYKEAIASQIIKIRQMSKFIVSYAKPNVKIILTGSSTKYALVQMGMIKRLEPNINPANLTAVTLLDEAIARAHLAARLKTTTDRIKNIVIWGWTCPDAINATVRMRPPGDLGATEEVDVPLHEALQDDRYLNEGFIECVSKRKITNQYSVSGKALATATARHLKALFQGGHGGEIVSMGVLTPRSEPYSLIAGWASSYPVAVPGNGTWKVMEDLKYSVATHLAMIKLMHNIRKDKPLESLLAIAAWIVRYEKENNALITINEKHHLLEILELPSWDLNYIVAELPRETVVRVNTQNILSRKSVAWDDSEAMQKQDKCKKSSIRFSAETSKKFRKKSTILRSSALGGQTVSLPPIMRNRSFQEIASNTDTIG